MVLKLLMSATASRLLALTTVLRLKMVNDGVEN